MLWRPGPAGGAEVAVVHRPRYDDWSLPKGKPEDGEPLAAAAAREIVEETGHIPVLGQRLPDVRYPVPAGQKTVHYWTARVAGGAFEASEEVDELRWLRAGQAQQLLSYAHDRRLLAGLDGATTIDATILLVRHAAAGKREDWHGDDDLRPLSGTGKLQAEGLRRVLPLFGARRVHSAPRTRCRQTVADLAADLGVEVVDEPLLSEEGYWADPVAALRKVVSIAQPAPGSAVVCSQGGAIPHIIGSLRARVGQPEMNLRSRKGSFWLLGFSTTPGGVRRLVTADHHPDALS
ncbi:MAG: NUDIX domain-containing protein [Pseudonocardiaceae bacterium]|nr:NUDIX domain-containing protein [Pseudonocardiaceae bacterium]